MADLLEPVSRASVTGGEWWRREWAVGELTVDRANLAVKSSSGRHGGMEEVGRESAVR
jgi:hypothetical protein